MRHVAYDVWLWLRFVLTECIPLFSLGMALGAWLVLSSPSFALRWALEHPARRHMVGVVLIGLLAGCSGVQHTPAQVARIDIEGAAIVLSVVDASAAAVLNGLHEAPGPAWDALVTWLEECRATLLLAQQSVDAWTASGGSACLAGAALGIARASLARGPAVILVAGIVLPEGYQAAVAQLDAALRQLQPACRQDGGTR